MKGDTPPAIPWKKGRAWVPGSGLTNCEPFGFGFRFGLAFQYETPYTTSLIGNALVVEAMLQERFQHLQLGSSRLWRRAIPQPGSLKWLERSRTDLGEHVVYFTYTTAVRGELAVRRIWGP